MGVIFDWLWASKFSTFLSLLVFMLFLSESTECTLFCVQDTKISCCFSL